MSFFLLFLLLFFSAFFAGSETAIFSLSKIEKRRVEKRYPWLSKWLMKHVTHPRKTLITLLIGNLGVNIFASSIVTLFAMHTWGVDSIGWAVAAFTLLLILFGEILPKILAVRNNEMFALVVSLPLHFFAALIFPIRWVMQQVTKRILSVMHQPKVDDEDISEDEIKSMLQIGEKEGILDRQERYMIQKLFELGERPVKDIMTPRIDLKAVDNEDSREEQIETLKKFHFTHFPVYHETLDNILGVVMTQDYMLNTDKELSELMIQPLFVPETKHIDDLLTELKKKNQKFAICVDEYGGTAGIVTLEDILEEIFGEYYDEYAQVENPIRPFGHQEYLVEAKISLADFNEYFNTDLEAEEASTLAGYIFEQMGNVPTKGEILSVEECDIRIHEVIRKRRIRRVVVRIHRD